MRTGFIVSGVAHAAFLAAAIFVPASTQPEPDETLDSTDVTIMSLEEFQALTQSTPDPVAEAPAVPIFEPDAIAAPEFNADLGAVPDAEMAYEQTEQDFVEDPQGEDIQPDLSAIRVVNNPDVAINIGGLDTSQAQASLPSAPSIAAPSAPSAPGFSRPAAPSAGIGSPGGGLGRPGASALPTIGAAAPPPPPKKPEPAEEEPAEDEKLAEDTPAEEEPAEEEPADQEPASEEAENPATQLAQSIRPKARPARPAVAPEPTPEQDPEPAPAETAETAPSRPDPSDQPAETANTTNGGQTTTETASSLPEGPPMTFGEKEGLRTQIEQFWSPPAGAETGTSVITVALELDINGNIVSDIRLVEPASPSAGHNAAFLQARIALHQAKPFDQLPKEKFAEWRRLEVTFNPEGVLY